ncbi:MAG: 3-deoxy-D-manno-octulosonic acid transferase [Azospirillaceae bacterium]
MIAWFYRVLTVLAGPLVPLLLKRRARRGKEVPERRRERLGRAARPRPAGRLIWVHGASVGETLSMLILIEALLTRDRALSVLVTTQTVTAARLMVERLPEGAFHQFVPVDRPAYARRFLDHWRPDAVLWVESELWPNLLDAIGRRGIPAALVNARMSARSARRWRRAAGFFRHVTGTFALVQPSGRETADRLASLGVTRLGPVGNLKFAAVPPAAEPEALAALRAALGERPVWLAASTHPGEEEVCLEAHRRLLAALPDALLILVPRHPERGAAVAALCEARDLTATRRHLGTLPGLGQAVYIADTLGELGLFFRVAPLAFIGGSLVEIGGHNPIEPALLGCAILTGPHVANFQEVYAGLMEERAALTVDSAEAMGETVARLLAAPDETAAMAGRARQAAERQRGILDRLLAALAPLLPRGGSAA